MEMPELLAFTRMTGDVVKAMRACPQPIVAAVDGVCAGAGAMLALASERVAELLGIAPANVGIKAKTPEGLDANHVAQAGCLKMISTTSSPLKSPTCPRKIFGPLSCCAALK